MDDLPPIDPDYTPAQREEIDRIAYLLSELRAYRDRGIVGGEAVAAVEAEKDARRAEIERAGIALGTLKAARSHAGGPAVAALGYAERAIGLDPGCAEAFELAARALVRLRELDRAIGLCREAIEVHGHAGLAVRLTALEAEQVQAGRTEAVASALDLADSAESRGDRESALASARDVLRIAPDHRRAILIALRSLMALGRLDEASDLVAALRRIAPHEASGWADRIRRARPVGDLKPAPDLTWIDDDAPVARAEIAAPGPPRVRWSTVAAAFLEDHWQKLILSLAVLLIVVSSTVGAAMVLGDRLWSPEGKCLLATAYTLMFAGFGRGLASWGAARAGRIMRLTTLIVLPLNFAMVGALPGLGRSSPLGLAVLAIDSAAMLALAWVVCRSMGIAGGAATPAGLMAMGMLAAMTPGSTPFAAGLGVILGATGVFVAASDRLAAWLAARRRDEAGGEAEEEGPYFAFGLLAFSYGCAVGRIGGGVLHLPATLYALPAMFGAIAALRVASGLNASGRTGPPTAMLRLAGFALSALGFALGLARPQLGLALYSGNTLAVALVGLALYARSLRNERAPAYLYAGFAALFLAYFGAYDFLRDFLNGLEGTVGTAMGYGRRLPFAFKAMNGLAFNTILAGLALGFARVWGDARLAWHCHRIGVPVSIGACILSCFEPTAALLTMGAYTVAYALAAPIFAAPRVVYLACLAFIGASVAASTSRGDLTIGARSLALAGVGLTLWAACRVLAAGRVAEAYRVPVVRSSRAVAVVALGFAAVAAWPEVPPSWSAAAALGALAILYALIGLETPLPSVALGAVGCAAVAALMAGRLAAIRQGWPADRSWLADWSGALALACQVASPGLIWLARVRETRTGRASRAGVYPGPLLGVGLALGALATWLAATHLTATLPAIAADGLARDAMAMGLVAAGLVIAAAVAGEAWLASSAVALGSVAAVLGALALAVSWGLAIGPAIAAPIVGGLALAMAALAELARRRASGGPSLFGGPLLAGSLIASGLGWAASGLAWGEPHVVAITVAFTAVALAVSARSLPARPLPDLALASGGLAWLLAINPATLTTAAGLPRDGLLGLIYVLASLTTAEAARRFGPKGEPGETRRAFGAALADIALVATVAALAAGAAALDASQFDLLTGILGLGAVALAWLPRFRSDTGLAHTGLTLGWLATGAAARWGLGAIGEGPLLGWLALVTAADGLLVVALRGACRRAGRDEGPARAVGVMLAAAGPALAIVAAGLRLDTFPMALAALVLTVPALIASAAFDRSPVAVQAAWVVASAAAYLALFALGRGREPDPSTLGLLATTLAVVAWGVERIASRPRWWGWHRVFASPLRDATLVLGALAILPEWNRPAALAWASVPFFLILSSRRNPRWLYPALGLLVASGAFAAVDRLGIGALTAWAVVTAFALRGLGAAIAWRGVGAYAGPADRLAIGLGVAALALRLDAVARLGEPWNAAPWVPAAVGLLALLMAGAFPGRGWLDGFAGLLSLAAVMAVGPRLDTPMAWGLALGLLALGWRAAARFDGTARVFAGWSLGLLGLGALAVGTRVVAEVLATTYGLRGAMPPPDAAEWWEGFAAIAVLGLNLAASRLDLARRLPVLHVTATLLIGWLTIAASPLMIRTGLDPAAMLPMAVGAQALAIASSLPRDRRVAAYACGLAFAGVALTAGRSGTATAAAIVLGAIAQARLALTWQWPGLAASASVLATLACLAVGDEVGRRIGWDGRPFEATVVAAGQTVAALGLVIVSGRDRRRRGDLARPVEWVALMALGVAATAGGLSIAGHYGPVDAVQARANVALMAAVGSLCVALAGRWSSMALAFAAQGAVLLGYAAFRRGFAMTPEGDAAAILILAGIDLGIAEVAGRGRRAFAVPALVTALILPVVSVLLAIRNGFAGPGPVFALFASGTFYAATCGRLRWKSLGYASAVLYNAALWALWSRFGWHLAEAPPFYLVPVGFTTILFAEANRRDLGRPGVNAVRGVGLTLIYLALAVPIWQTASLAAWAAILGASTLAVLAGIGLRSQSFLWLGLAGFVLDVVYQLGRIGREHALAKWGIMLGLGIALVLFVALNEKKRLLATIRKYVDEVRAWE